MFRDEDAASRSGLGASPSAYQIFQPQYSPSRLRCSIPPSGSSASPSPDFDNDQVFDSAVEEANSPATQDSHDSHDSREDGHVDHDDDDDNDDNDDDVSKFKPKPPPFSSSESAVVAQQWRRVNRILAHRVFSDEALVELLVKWTGCDEPTWEPEWRLQQDVAPVVYHYWQRQGGRLQATGLAMYHVFHIHRHRVRDDGRVEMFVQWVGYGQGGGDMTWEPVMKIRDVAPVEMKKYMQVHPDLHKV